MQVVLQVVHQERHVRAQPPQRHEQGAPGGRHGADGALARPHRLVGVGAGVGNRVRVRVSVSVKVRVRVSVSVSVRVRVRPPAVRSAPASLPRGS